MNPRSHIFISYARLDGEEVARTIHQRLESEHLTCWRDRLDLTGGEEFWTQLETGIAGARWVLIVLTPAALQSEWTAKEWREARKRGIPICPVWTSNATALGEMLAQNPLPAGMQRGHIYTPFAEPETSPRSDEEWRNVVATLRQEKDVRYAPFMAPPLPAGYVERPIEVEAVTTQLLGERRGQAVAATALRGVGGMGKTTLAQAVAHRDDVVDAFYDGVLWATVGIQPKLVEVITDLCLALGPKQTFAGLNAAESHLRGMLRDRRCLVILDDVWRTTDVTPLLGLGPLVTTLVTTRVADVARAVGRTKGIVLDQMTPDQATDMLMSALGDNPTSPKTHRSPIVLRCRTLAERLGRWPFVLALAAAQVRLQLDFGEGPEGALEWIAGRMDREGVASLDADARPEDFDDSRKRDRAFATSIGGSLSLLGERERRAFFDLGIFPEDVEIPLATAAQLWSVPDAKPIALKLANLALVDLRLGDRPVIRLHDLILTFIAQRLRDENRWSDTHRRLLDAWKDPAAPPNPFGWRWVCRHLKEAGEEARLIEMLFEYDLVSKRLVAEGVGIDRLVSDYGLLDHVVEAAHVGQALARAAHIIAPRPDLLSQQLLGRVTITTPLAMRLLSGTRGRAPRHALLPRTPSLASRGSVMRQLAHHEGGVSRLALTEDGRVVTGGGDSRVLCARLDGGEPVPLAQHEGGVFQLALTGDGRVVTGGRDGRVFCARLEGGDPVPLAQHEGWVSHLALTEDGRVVTGGEDGRDGRVLCARLEGGEAVPLAQHKGGVSQLALTGDGRVVTGGRDGRLMCARLEGGEAVPLAQHEGGVSQLALTGDGRVVTGGLDGRVLCARLEGGEVVRLAQHEGAVSQLALTRDGRVVTGGTDGRVLCARLEGGEVVPLAQHEGGVFELALTGDGRVVTGGTDGRVLCARLEGGEAVPLAEHEGAVLQLALTGDGRVVTGGTDGRVLCARLEGGEAVPLARHEGGVLQLALTGDGRVVTGGSDGRVLCARLEGGEAVLLAQHERGVFQLALTGDGRVVTGGRDGRVLCARLEGGAAVPVAQHEGGISQLALTGDGRVVTGGRDGRVLCARLEGGVAVPLAQHEGAVSQLALTGTGALSLAVWMATCCARASRAGRRSPLPSTKQEFPSSR